MYTPMEVAQNYIATGLKKMKTSAPTLFVLAVIAGMFIGLAAVGATIVSVTVQSASLGKLLGAMVFPVGLIMTLIAGSELFTGNCLLIIPVLEREARIAKMLRNWCIVYIGNFVGSILVAALTVYGGTFNVFAEYAAGAAVIKTAAAKASLAFDDALFRGILCNFLVCIAVWISFAAKDVVGKVAGMFMPVMLFVLCGYEHSVANMYYIPAGIFALGNPYYATEAITHGVNVVNLNWGNMLVNNLIPVTLGNIIGGMVLVGGLYWFTYLRDGARTAAESKSSQKELAKKGRR